MTELGYLGADIVLDKQRGALLLELNARPGLAIQIANGIGMLPRTKSVNAQRERNLSAAERVDYVMQAFGAQGAA